MYWEGGGCMDDGKKKQMKCKLWNKNLIREVNGIETD